MRSNNPRPVLARIKRSRLVASTCVLAAAAIGGCGDPGFQEAPTSASSVATEEPIAQSAVAQSLVGQLRSKFNVLTASADTDGSDLQVPLLLPAADMTTYHRSGSVIRPRGLSDRVPSDRIFL